MKIEEQMKIKFIAVGKTDTEYFRDAITVYENRIQRYVPFEFICLPEIRISGKLTESQLKAKEGDAILSRLNSADELILLDERGKEYSSSEFSLFVASKINAGNKYLTFVAGGAYGFSDEVYSRAKSMISLSRMTFTHQMVRLIFVEQLYRAFTIMKNEPYHHE
jgi:23S rRNA (pseudouridine1915-N3)-methyltransferase